MRLKKFAIFFALGFEFVGLVVGGAIVGHIIGGKIKLQEGIGASVGVLLGFLTATLFTAQIIRKMKKEENYDK